MHSLCNALFPPCEVYLTLHLYWRFVAGEIKFILIPKTDEVETGSKGGQHYFCVPESIDIGDVILVPSYQYINQENWSSEIHFHPILARSELLGMWRRLNIALTKWLPKIIANEQKLDASLVRTCPFIRVEGSPGIGKTLGVWTWALLTLCRGRCGRTDVLVNEFHYIRFGENMGNFYYARIVLSTEGEKRWLHITKRFDEGTVDDLKPLLESFLDSKEPTKREATGRFLVIDGLKHKNNLTDKWREWLQHHQNTKQFDAFIELTSGTFDQYERGSPSYMFSTFLNPWTIEDVELYFMQCPSPYRSIICDRFHKCILSRLGSGLLETEAKIQMFVERIKDIQTTNYDCDAIHKAGDQFQALKDDVEKLLAKAKTSFTLDATATALQTLEKNVKEMKKRTKFPSPSELADWKTSVDAFPHKTEALSTVSNQIQDIVKTLNSLDDQDKRSSEDPDANTSKLAKERGIRMCTSLQVFLSQSLKVARCAESLKESLSDASCAKRRKACLGSIRSDAEAFLTEFQGYTVVHRMDERSLDFKEIKGICDESKLKMTSQLTEYLDKSGSEAKFSANRHVCQTLNLMIHSFETPRLSNLPKHGDVRDDLKPLAVDALKQMQTCAEKARERAAPLHILETAMSMYVDVCGLSMRNWCNRNGVEDVGEAQLKRFKKLENDTTCFRVYKEQPVMESEEGPPRYKTFKAGESHKVFVSNLSWKLHLMNPKKDKAVQNLKIPPLRGFEYEDRIIRRVTHRDMGDSFPSKLHKDQFKWKTVVPYDPNDPSAESLDSFTGIENSVAFIPRMFNQGAFDFVSVFRETSSTTIHVSFFQITLCAHHDVKQHFLDEFLSKHFPEVRKYSISKPMEVSQCSLWHIGPGTKLMAEYVIVTPQRKRVALYWKEESESHCLQRYALTSCGLCCQSPHAMTNYCS